MLTFLWRERRRLLLVLLLLLVGSALMLRLSRRGVPGTTTAERGAQALWIPAGNLIHTLLGLPEDLIRNLNEISRARQENERLLAEVSDLQREISAQRLVEADNQRLRELLKLKMPHQTSAQLGEVVSHDPSTWYATFLVNLGKDDGIETGSPVVTPQGVVGRVIEVFPGRSRVLLEEEPSSSVAVVDVRSRVRGIAVGTGKHRLKLRYVAAGSDVESGDLLVTSGMGGVFPRGLPVGTVVKKGLSENGLNLDVDVAPAVDSGSADYVYIIRPQEGLH